MMAEQTLFDKAASNLRNARLVFDHMDDDDLQLNFVSYHLQQALELAIKYQLELNGVEYPKTHDIDQLIRLAKESNTDLSLTEYLEDHAEMFSQWEAKTRYLVGYMVECRKVQKALEELEAYFEMLVAREWAEVSEALQES